MNKLILLIIPALLFTPESSNAQELHSIELVIRAGKGIKNVSLVDVLVINNQTLDVSVQRIKVGAIQKLRVPSKKGSAFDIVILRGETGAPLHAIEQLSAGEDQHLDLTINSTTKRTLAMMLRASEILNDTARAKKMDIHELYSSIKLNYIDALPDLESYAEAIIASNDPDTTLLERRESLLNIFRKP